VLLHQTTYLYILFNPLILDTYLQIAIFTLGAVIFLAFSFVLSAFLRPSRPNAEKLTNYESGEEPVGSANAMFNPRFVVFALLFVLFEVEIVLLYPLATVFGSVSSWFIWCELISFVLILGIALAYAWQNDLLEWDRPKPLPPVSPSRIPETIYNELKRISKHRA
jgi:NADH-quinone oxidoreductase subunit A